MLNVKVIKTKTLNFITVLIINLNVILFYKFESIKNLAGIGRYPFSLFHSS